MVRSNDPSCVLFSLFLLAVKMKVDHVLACLWNRPDNKVQLFLYFCTSWFLIKTFDWCGPFNRRWSGQVGMHDMILLGSQVKGCEKNKRPRHQEGHPVYLTFECHFLKDQGLKSSSLVNDGWWWTVHTQTTGLDDVEKNNNRVNGCCGCGAHGDYLW